MLEQTGQILDVGRWVLHEACAQMAAVARAAATTLDISVNVSGRQLDHDAHRRPHPRRARAQRTRPATPDHRGHRDRADARRRPTPRARLQAIKELGVRIAVDDFGTGYSSLAYLQQFPVDCLKIDRRFTSAITTSPESKALIRTLVQLGKDLGLKTLAEGVETADEMDHLRHEHVNEAQASCCRDRSIAQALEAPDPRAQLVPTTSSAARDAASLDETYDRHLAETLDALPEQVVRYRLPDLTIVYCNASWASVVQHRTDRGGRVASSTSSCRRTVRPASRRNSPGSVPTISSSLDIVVRDAPNAPGQWVEWVDRYMPEPRRRRGARRRPRRHGPPHRRVEVWPRARLRFRELADKSADVMFHFVLRAVSALRLHEPFGRERPRAIHRRSSSTTSPSFSTFSPTRAER